MQPSFDGSQNASETPATESETPDGAARRSACVVLLAPGDSSAPEELIGALERRGLQPACVDTCFGAMAELTTRTRLTDAPRVGQGGALIVVEPGAQARGRLDDLLGSVVKFLPGAALWAYEAEATPRLHRLEAPAREPEIVVKSEAARSAGAAARNGATEPTLRLRRDEDDAPTPEPAEAPLEEDDDIDQSLLSAEELSMLLADDDEGERP